MAAALIPSSLESALQQLFDAVLTVDASGAIQEVDQGGLRMFGYDAERGSPDHLRDLVPASLLLPLLGGLTVAAETGRCTLAPVRLESPAGDRWLDLALGAGDDGQYLILVRDASERVMAEDKRLATERKLRRDEKMACIARLAGGIANDLHNILGAILSFASCLREDLEEGSTDSEVLRHITDACWRGADLASELGAIAGDTHLAKETISVNELVREVADLIERAVSPRVEVETTLVAGAARVHGTRALISQAITNLALNAVDSMKAGGVLTLSTGLRELTPAELESHPDLAPGKYVVLSVSDTGEAMDEATAAHAFEPFYAGWSAESSSALALPLVYSVARGHRGDVALRSEPNRGTELVVYLPAHAPPVEADRTEAPRSSAARADTVLVVDDDLMVRESCRRLLERLGHRVLLASSGATAIELFREHSDEIAVVILDLVMPGLNGRETFDKLRSLAPAIEIIICSGYPGEIEANELLAAGATEFLAKPFGLDTLRRVLADTSLGS